MNSVQFIQVKLTKNFLIWDLILSSVYTGFCLIQGSLYTGFTVYIYIYMYVHVTAEQISLYYMH